MPRVCLFRLVCVIVSTIALASETRAQSRPEIAPNPSVAIVSRANLISNLLDHANFWILQGRPVEASGSLTRVLTIDAGNEDALSVLGHIQAEAGNLDAARDTLARLKAAHPESSQIGPLAVSLQTGKIDPNKLAEAQRLATEGRSADSIKIYVDLFHGDKPTQGLALEYYLTLGGTDGGFGKAYNGLMALSHAFPRERNVTLGLAQLETYREDTRNAGIDRLWLLISEPSVSAEAARYLRRALLWLSSEEVNVPNFERYLARYPNDTALKNKIEIARSPATVDEGAVVRQAGFAALKDGNIAEAELLFGQALTTNAEDFDATGGMGLVRYRQNRAVEARELLAKAAAKEPSWNRALADVTPAALREASGGQTGDNNTAGAAIVAQYQRVKRLTGAGQFDGAEKLLMKLIGKNGKWGDFYQLGNIQARAGRLADAKDSFRKAAALNKREIGPVLALASILEHEGKVIEAQNILENATAGNEEVAFARSALLRRLALAEFDPARKLEFLQQAVKIAPTDPWARVDLARMLDEQSRHAEAVKLLEPLTSGSKVSLEAIKAAGIYAQGRNDIAKASGLFARLPEQYRTPDMLEVIQLFALREKIARIVSAGGPVTKNLMDLAAAHVTDGHSAVEVSNTLIKLWDPTAARQVLVFAIGKNEPLSPSKRLAYGSGLIQAGFDFEAADLLREVDLNKLSVENLKTYQALQDTIVIHLTDTLRTKGSVQKAEVALQAQLNKSPNSLGLKSAEARLLLSVRQPKAAMEVSQSVMTASPYDLDIKRTAVLAAISMNDYVTAETLIASAKQMAPDDPRPFLMDADVARSRNLNRAALAATKRAHDLREQQVKYNQLDGG